MRPGPVGGPRAAGPPFYLVQGGRCLANAGLILHCLGLPGLSQGFYSRNTSPYVVTLNSVPPSHLP